MESVRHREGEERGRLIKVILFQGLHKYDSELMVELMKWGLVRN